MIPSWNVQADPGVSHDTFLKSVVVITTFSALSYVNPLMNTQFLNLGLLSQGFEF